MFMIYTGMMEWEGQGRGQTSGWGTLLVQQWRFHMSISSPMIAHPTSNPNSVSVGSEPGAHPNIPQRSVIFHIFWITIFIIVFINIISFFLPIISLGDLILWCCWVFFCQYSYSFFHESTLLLILVVTWNRGTIDVYTQSIWCK